MAATESPSQADTSSSTSPSTTGRVRLGRFVSGSLATCLGLIAVALASAHQVVWAILCFGAMVFFSLAAAICQYFSEPFYGRVYAQKYEWLRKLCGFVNKSVFKFAHYVASPFLLVSVVLLLLFQLVWFGASAGWPQTLADFSIITCAWWRANYIPGLLIVAIFVIVPRLVPWLIIRSPSEAEALDRLLATDKVMRIDARLQPVHARRYPLEGIMSVRGGEVRCFAIHFNDFISGTVSPSCTLAQFLGNDPNNSIRLIMHNPFHRKVRSRSRNITGRYRNDYVAPFFENIKLMRTHGARATFKVHNDKPFLRFFLLPEAVICQVYEKDTHGFRSMLSELGKDDYPATYNYFAGLFEKAWSKGTLVRKGWLEGFHLAVTLQRAAYALDVAEWAWPFARAKKADLRKAILEELRRLDALQE